jgi:hypothetical protein
MGTITGGSEAPTNGRRRRQARRQARNRRPTPNSLYECRYGLRIESVDDLRRALGCALKIAREAKEQHLGPVTFLIESGQPNAEFVRRSIEVQRDNEYFAVASADIVHKRGHITLQAADFLAHVAGTHQVKWLERVIGEGPARRCTANVTARPSST